MPCYFWETCLKSHAGFLHTGFKQNALPQFVLFQELTRQARSTSERFATRPSLPFILYISVSLFWVLRSGLKPFLFFPFFKGSALQ